MPDAAVAKFWRGGFTQHDRPRRQHSLYRNIILLRNKIAVSRRAGRGFHPGGTNQIFNAHRYASQRSERFTSRPAAINRGRLLQRQFRRRRAERGNQRLAFSHAIQCRFGDLSCRDVAAVNVGGQRDCVAIQ